MAHSTSMADVYTHGHHDSVLRSHRWRTAENSAAYLLDRLHPGMSLLDVGCGPGNLTADLASRVAPGRVVGLDVVPGILEEAREAAGGLPHVSIVRGDVYSLGFADDSFDVVHAHQVIQHLTDPVAALREMARVCRPGGLVAVRDADYRAMSWWPRSPGLDHWMDLYQAVARANGAEPDAGRRLRAWAREARLFEISASASVWSFISDSERRWWGGLWADRMRHSELARQAVAYGVADEERLNEISDAWQTWVRAEDGWFVVVHGEILCRPE